MDLKAKIQEDTKTAMRARDTVRLDVLRMLSAEIKKREIDKRTALDTAEIFKTIQSLVKQRHDSVDAFVKGNREDLAAKERAEIEVLSAYLPTQLSDSELESIVAAAVAEVVPKGASDLGKVMKAALAKADGRADGKKLNELVRAKIAAL